MRFFIDNNLSLHLAKGMKEFGEDVIHLTEKFQPATNDEIWLEFVGKNGFVLITRDERIRWNPAERAAFRKYKVGAFFLGGKNLTRCQLIQQLVRNWPKVKNTAAKETRPFAFRIPPSGAKFSYIPI